MWLRGGLLVVALGGCYSPKFDTCSLTCAAEDVCPNGFECSNGRCAIEGTSCLFDGGADNNTAGCGDGTQMDGEICFKTPVQINTATSGIFDAQFVDTNGDGAKDIAFLTSTGYAFRVNTGGTFNMPSTAGPVIPGQGHLLVDNLDGNIQPELIMNDPIMGRVVIHVYNTNTWMLGGQSPSQMAEAILASGRLANNTTSTPSSIVELFSDSLRMYLLPAGGALTPLMPSSTVITIAGGRDVAVGDYDNNNVGEIAVADDVGIQVFRGLNNALTKVDPGPALGKPVDSLINCNVDGDGDSDIVYAIRATQQAPGSVGAVRALTSTTYEVMTPTTIPNMFGQIDCVDIDNDNYGDAIVAAGDGNMNVDVLVLRGRQDGTFEPPIKFRVPSPLTHLHAKTDYNNDGVPDIILTSASMGLITILESNP